MQIFTHERQLTPSWQLVRPSIQLLKKYIWQTLYLGFLPALLLTAAAFVVPRPGADSFSDMRPEGLILYAVALTWVLLTAPGFYRLQAQAIQGKEISTSDAFKQGLKRFFRFFATMILAVLAIVLGLILFIIPGLLLLRGFLLAPYYAVDADLSPVEALKQSYRDSRPVTAWLWGIIGVQAVFSLAANLFSVIVIIGPLLALITTFIYIYAPALRYGEIVKNIPVTTAD